MKKIIAALVAVVLNLVAFSSASLVVTPAYAGECGSNLTHDACLAAKRAAVAPAYTGPLAEYNGPIACVRVLTYDRTEMILVAGPKAQGPVLTSQRQSAGRFIRLANLSGKAGDIYIGELCFPRSLIAGLRAITICNGDTPSKGFHHTLSLADDSASYLRRLQQTGQAGDFLSLLGESLTYSPSIANVYTSGLYSQMYGG